MGMKQTKPQIWKWKNCRPEVIAAAMRECAIEVMLRDMWSAAAIERAKYPK